MTNETAQSDGRVVPFCEDCEDTGRLQCDNCDGHGETPCECHCGDEHTAVCPDCDGRGWVPCACGVDGFAA